MKAQKHWDHASHTIDHIEGRVRIDLACHFSRRRDSLTAAG